MDTSSRPNVVIITTHDTGRHIGPYGVETVVTPHLDSLASESVRLTDLFCTVPICCASRASMMTGLYPQSHGLLDLHFPPFNYAMRDPDRHLSHLLRSAGYQTHLFGFQHEAYDTSDLGFDTVTASNPTPPCNEVADSFETFLHERSESDRPFYAQIGFFETHSPFTWGGAEPDDSEGIYVPPYLVRNEPIERMIGEFQGMVRKADAAVGDIIGAVQQNGIENDTVFVYTTDHGVEFPRAKWTVHDAGIEIAMLVKWPGGGVGGGRTCNWVSSNVDFVPTLLDLLDIEIPPYVEGVSFAGGLRDTGEPPSRDRIYALYTKRCQSRCVRTREHKFILNYDVDRWYRQPVDITRFDQYSVSPNVALYDLETDPLEFENRADDTEYADVRDDLEDSLFSWMESTQDPILEGPLRTPFYDATDGVYKNWKERQS